MKRIPILACGNTLRGDDGVAWRIGDALARQNWYDRVEVVYTAQLLPEHAELLRDTQLAIFLDCSATTDPGMVSTIHLGAARELPPIFTHHLDPASMLALTGRLYGTIPRESLAITVGGQAFDLGETLSDAVKAAIPFAVAVIGASVEEFIVTVQ